MTSSQGPASAAYRAADEARRLGRGWFGPEHVLLALFAEPSPATEALEEVGVTRERVEEDARALGRGDPPPPGSVPGRGLSPNPAWYRLTGCAEGLALAWGGRGPDRSTSCSPWLPGDPGEGRPRRARVDGEEGVAWRRPWPRPGSGPGRPSGRARAAGALRRRW